MRCLEFLVHIYHGKFDDIRSTPLYRRIHCQPFSELAYHVRRSIDFVNCSFSAHHGCGKAGFFADFYLLIHIFLYFAMLCKVGMNVVLCFLAAYMQFFAETKPAHSVYYAEVHGFCPASVKRSDFLRRNAQDTRCRGSVNVFSVIESFNKAFILRKVCQDAQFNL